MSGMPALPWYFMGRIIQYSDIYGLFSLLMPAARLNDLLGSLWTQQTPLHFLQLSWKHFLTLFLAAGAADLSVQGADCFSPKFQPLPSDSSPHRRLGRFGSRALLWVTARPDCSTEVLNSPMSAAGAAALSPTVTLQSHHSTPLATTTHVTGRLHFFSENLRNFPNFSNFGTLLLLRRMLWSCHSTDGWVDSACCHFCTRAPHEPHNGLQAALIVENPLARTEIL